VNLLITFLLVLCKSALVPLKACGEVQTPPIPVAWSLVVTLQTAKKAKFKQTIKCLRLIIITFKENHSTAHTTMVVYLSENPTVGVKPM